MIIKTNHPNVVSLPYTHEKNTRYLVNTSIIIPYLRIGISGFGAFTFNPGIVVDLGGITNVSVKKIFILCKVVRFYCL